MNLFLDFWTSLNVLSRHRVPDIRLSLGPNGVVVRVPEMMIGEKIPFSKNVLQLKFPFTASRRDQSVLY